MGLEDPKKNKEKNSRILLNSKMFNKTLLWTSPELI